MSGISGPAGDMGPPGEGAFVEHTLAPSRLYVFVRRNGSVTLTSGVHADDIGYVRADIADAMLKALELTIEWSPDIPTDTILNAIAKAKGESE